MSEKSKEIEIIRDDIKLTEFNSSAEGLKFAELIIASKLAPPSLKTSAIAAAPSSLQFVLHRRIDFNSL